ncbi:hypothetical protein HMPREF1640_06935 [Prevotella sp. S7-1-8]|nr:hypothetical protein HMPREF1640_06935 [Prevotella sp. S7-1-8]
MALLRAFIAEQLQAIIEMLKKYHKFMPVKSIVLERDKANIFIEKSLKKNQEFRSVAINIY